jgi:hypothetical protein
MAETLAPFIRAALSDSWGAAAKKDRMISIVHLVMNN